jgi:VanZ family protein
MRKAIVGSLLILLTYGLWLGYFYILQNDLFYFHDWLDTPLHLIGGFISALLISLILYFRTNNTDSFIFYYYIIWWSLFIGVGWEYLEFYLKLHEPNPSLQPDTITDLLADFIGAVIGAIMVGVINFRTKKPSVNQ